MSKFQPPEWANWMAMDADGWWLYYKTEPYLIDYEWQYRDMDYQLAYKTKPVKNWRDQLYRITWEEV